MLEVEKAYADAVEAKAREEAWDKAEHIAKQWISTVQDHIDLGTWDERSLLEPLRSYANARAQHLYALMDYNVAMSSLALASGWDSAAPTAGTVSDAVAGFTRGRWPGRASRGGGP